MYHLINNHIQQILQSILPDHVTEYDWLVQNINNVETPDYQGRYRKYWAINVARLSTNYCQVYFQHLQNGLNGNQPQPGNLANQLYQIPTHRNGRHSLQFSFCSKLCHMLNTQMPIYDAMVRDFYFFAEPSRQLNMQQRVNQYIQFYQFLVSEYNRVLNNNLLCTSIQSFRQQFNPQQFTDQKIIDSLIWAFVSLQRRSRAVIYC